MAMPLYEQGSTTASPGDRSSSRDDANTGEIPMRSLHGGATPGSSPSSTWAEFSSFRHDPDHVHLTASDSASKLAIQYISGWRLVAVMTGITLTCFLVLLDVSILVTAIPSIITEFHSLFDIGWYGSAYNLASCALQPLSGKLYTYLSAKWTFLSFFFIFEAGSLICALAGAVGQAAIMLAQHIGAEIFATVGRDSKRDLVHDKFGIPHDHIFSSRTTGFYAGVKDMTADYGVDVVLNSLSGEMFRHSCDLVAPFGRFVEIGRKDLMDDALMPMSYLLKNITFGYVDMALIIDTNKPLARRVLHDVATLLAQGHINPVMLTSMPISDIEAAFRLIQAGKHTGKIILRVEEKQEIKAIPAVPATAKFRPDASYAVVGGFGGIGHAVIEWMADNGAKHIVCISRSGAKSQKNMEFMENIKAKGVSLIAARCDITSESEVSSLARQFKETTGLYPIRGVIQSSAVFDDGLFEQMTAERWWNVLGPKVEGTKNLDNAFKDADFFVVMSSIVSLCGNDGQANYAAACCFQDELVRQRAASGSHAFSMNIGPVDDVGWLSENLDVAKEVERRGFASVSIKQVLSMLNYAIMHQPDRNDPNSSVCAISPRPYASDSDEQARKREKRFAHIVNVGTDARVTSSGDGHDALSQLDKAGTFNDAVDLVCGALLKQLGKLIATPEEMLSPANSLDYYGVDSLIAVEMRNWIVAYLKADLPLMMIRGTGSILELAKLISNESPLVGSY